LGARKSEIVEVEVLKLICWQLTDWHLFNCLFSGQPG